MFGNYRAINIKQLPDCLLGKPYITVLHPDFNRVGRVVFFGENEKVSRANQISEALNIPLRTLQRELSRLKAAGQIEFRGAPKNGGYYECSL